MVANAVHGGGSGKGGAGGGGGGVLTAGGSATQRKALRERRKGGGVLGTQVSLLSKEVIHTVEPLNRLSLVWIHEYFQLVLCWEVCPKVSFIGGFTVAVKVS